ncbi:MAG: DUF433 domain-containing protein [Leptolyngbyaceae cyanobacterium RM2_2_4]|nr:DUF433 domain-containing protein [Leptolyngbyaceae cyanobacterium SM1_4_3]NJO51401.1 DUF433 domain-containing protein [Leptolyngbyaceae cyanobacterium RM2_2_4]NJO74897.1 DUF433 domain-containing protein [Leptolyngbyaceae cyanobacterium RM1_406_9]
MATAARVIHSDPDILGGTPVFVGTRVPVKTLLDYLEAGDSLDEFLDHFPSVQREQAIAALELAKEMLIAYANPAG